MAAFRFVEVRRGSENRHAFGHQRIKNAPEIPPGHRVDSVGWLIKQDNLGSVNQRAHQAEFLFHAAGKISGKPAPEITEARCRQQFLGPPLTLLANDSK